MATEWEFLFNVASRESAHRNRAPEAMAQVQPHPKRLDRTKRIQPGGILLHRSDDPCSTSAPSVGKSFIKAKLPYIFAYIVMLFCQTSILISPSLHCS